MFAFEIGLGPGSLRPGPGARTADAVALLPANDLIRIPRGNFLMFTITNIFNCLVPAGSAVFTLIALSRGRTCTQPGLSCNR